MAPIDLLLDKATQRWGLKILLSQDNHPCKRTPLALLRQNYPPRNSPVLRQECHVMRQLIQTSSQLEDPTHHKLEWMTPPIIPRLDRTVEANSHMAWLKFIETRAILAYRDGSKETEGTTASACHIFQIGTKG
ncbi:hypothetical protein Q9L58_010242 [Maublancomyces gigas]|uniref:Uncharacterized protein n=1 Tax=Discina gigas TaxID=1032678 RepID=A0ABR3G4P3_9PEZI